MEGNEVVLTEEEIAAKKQAEIDAAKKPELTEEEIEAIIEKRLGGKPSDFIRKTEQVKVLTPEEKKELEEKEQSEALKFGLEQNFVSKKEYDSYLELTATNRIDIARKKFIESNTDLGEDAGKLFDKIIKLEEDDEIEDGEKLVPNKEKAAAMAWATKMADEEINTKYGNKIKGLPEKYKNHLAEQEVKKVNTEVITKAITEIPKRLEVEVEGEKYGVDLTDDDFKEAHNLVVEGALLKKGLTAEEVKGTADAYLFAKRAKDLVAEVRKIAYAKGVDDTERGAKGIVSKSDSKIESSDAREFLKKFEIPIV